MRTINVNVVRSCSYENSSTWKFIIQKFPNMKISGSTVLPKCTFNVLVPQVKKMSKSSLFVKQLLLSTMKFKTSLTFVFISNGSAQGETNWFPVHTQYMEMLYAQVHVETPIDSNFSFSMFATQLQTSVPAPKQNTD